MSPTWPQVVIAIIILWNFICGLQSSARKHNGAVYAFVIDIAGTAAYVWILHEGGFWTPLLDWMRS